MIKKGSFVLFTLLSLVVTVQAQYYFIAFDTLMNKRADNLSDKNGMKQGCWEIKGVPNDLDPYYCPLDGPDADNSAKGYFEKGVPVNTWIKYNSTKNPSVIEYFFKRGLLL